MNKDPFYQLELAQEYMDEGQEDKARQLVLLYIDEVPANGDLCFRWAKICEGLGMAKHAMKFYRKALKAEPGSSRILYNYAILLNNIGYYEDSIHYLRKTIKVDPEHMAARRLLSKAYHALGLHGQADALYAEPQKRPETTVRYFPPTIGNEHLNRIMELFSGRETGYAVQIMQRFKAEPIYVFEDSPISCDLIRKHINGEITIGLYPVRSDKTVKYALIETRLKARVLKENIKNQAYLKYLEEMLLSYILSLKRVASYINLPAYVDCSGGFSFRLWFFFKEFIHFLKAREFLKRFMEHAPPPHTYINIEPFMGTKGVGIGWIEHPVLLPFGINRATKRRALFLDEDGVPYPDQLMFLKRIQELPFKECFQAVKKTIFPAPNSMANDFPATIENMINSCIVLSGIVRKAQSSRILSREEKVILFYTIGILDEDGRALHSILNPCPDYNYTKVERQRVRLKSNPISCIKIRELIPEYTASVSCNCVFDLRGGRYPSPVMHINPFLVPPRDELDISENQPIRELARKYISLSRQRSELDMAIHKIKKFFEKYYARTGKDKISIDGVELCRSVENSSIKWNIKA